MNKEYIPYEQAFELKELGYDDECTMYYAPGHPEGYYLVDATPLTNSHWMFTADDNKDRHLMCTAPLYQQAFRWFREKYCLSSWVYTSNNKEFWYSILKDGRMLVRDYKPYDTHQEAELECLKKLIEIIDRKSEAYQ